MNLTQKLTQENVFKRVLWAYGIHLALLFAFFVIGYLFLPEGILKGSPTTFFAKEITKQKNFFPHMGQTFLTNLGLCFFVGVGLNFIRIRRFPLGYFVVIATGIFGGLIAGTNSFLGGISTYTLEGWLIALRIGFLEMLGYACIIATTVSFGLYQYQSWWRWEGKPTKVTNFHDIRLSRQEWIVLIVGILLLIIAAYNETVVWFG